MANVEKIFLRAAAMARACGLDGIDAAIMLCSLLSLKGEEIERTIYFRRIKNELYEDAKRLVGQSGGVGEVLKQAKGIAEAESREISAIELFCLIGLATSLAPVYQSKGLGREMLEELLESSRAKLKRVVDVGDPIGIMWMFENQSDFLFRCTGLALAVMGAVSFWLMVSGAFKYNSGSSCWLSLFGRVAVILLLVFALGRLQEKLEQYKRGELGVIRGVLIPLIVFAWMFNFLIRPMIRTERCRW